MCSRVLGQPERQAQRCRVEKRFADGRRRAHDSLAKRDTADVLGMLFNRIYTLRNQLMHGSATCNGTTNCAQVRDAIGLLGKLVPLIILLMLDNLDTPWGDASSPVVDAE